MTENSVFPVPAAIRDAAHADSAKYQAMYERSVQDPDGFWRDEGKRLDCIKTYSKDKNVNFNACKGN